MLFSFRRRSLVKARLLIQVEFTPSAKKCQGLQIIRMKLLNKKSFAEKT